MVSPRFPFQNCYSILVSLKFCVYEFIWLLDNEQHLNVGFKVIAKKCKNKETGTMSLTSCIRTSSSPIFPNFLTLANIQMVLNPVMKINSTGWFLNPVTEGSFWNIRKVMSRWMCMNLFNYRGLLWETSPKCLWTIVYLHVIKLKVIVKFYRTPGKGEL